MRGWVDCKTNWWSLGRVLWAPGLAQPAAFRTGEPYDNSNPMADCRNRASGLFTGVEGFGSGGSDLEAIGAKYKTNPIRGWADCKTNWWSLVSASWALAGAPSSGDNSKPNSVLVGVVLWVPGLAQPAAFRTGEPYDNSNPIADCRNRASGLFTGVKGFGSGESDLEAIGAKYKTNPTRGWADCKTNWWRLVSASRALAGAPWNGDNSKPNSCW